MYYTIYKYVCQYINYDFSLTVCIVAICADGERHSKTADCAYAADLYISGTTKPLTLHRHTMGADRQRQPPIVSEYLNISICDSDQTCQAQH